MPGLDVFNSDAFSMQSLTGRVNRATYVPGQIGRTGIFAEDGVTTTIVSIDERNGHLALVEPTPRGGPGESTTFEDRRVIPIAVPHYQRDDMVSADEVQNVRAFGSESDLEVVQDRVDAKAAKHGRDLQVTLEHQLHTWPLQFHTAQTGLAQPLRQLANFFIAHGVSVLGAGPCGEG